MKIKISIPRLVVVSLLVFVFLVSIVNLSSSQPSMLSRPQLVSDPFLQLPTENSVRVVWFTEFAGKSHTVAYGKDLQQSIAAKTTKLSRTREDAKSRWGNQNIEIDRPPISREIWRHEAEISGLVSGVRVPYRVTSVREDGEAIDSAVFSLTAKPNSGTPLKILLTSDHQLMPMVAANLQKVAETVGRVDAVFFAGDLVNVPDRASEWFDDSRGGAFFPCLQGRASYELEKNGVKTTYKGGELLQHAPLFGAIGNHEVMGRFSSTNSLNEEFNDAVPRSQGLTSPPAPLLQGEGSKIPPFPVREGGLGGLGQSFNINTYEEIFTLPQSDSGGQKYYAVTFGDIRLVVLYVTNIWRSPSLAPNVKGRYREREADFNYPERWGYGQHIFEAIRATAEANANAKGSEQYAWLESELNSAEFQQAKYKVVMFHHPPHTLGDNIVPAYTDPVQIVDRDPNGNVKAVRYEYPKDADYIIRDVVPLLEAAGVQLVFFGHSHLWNRFVGANGIHYLESSNVGNTYGAAIGNNKRPVPSGYREEYVATGDPNGLEPVIPTISPLTGEDGQPLPYVASNDITAFSILDTGTGTVSSYRFDTRSPASEVIKFDEFQL
ncbi:MAG: metallophosphoesterase [Cyanosarcina radialis HA8281-LM2]|nr:metallophosphoesterase [Cyanosarcina radialis HA8281-LM2]